MGGRRGTWSHPPSFAGSGGSGGALGPVLVAGDAATLLRGRRGTWFWKLVIAGTFSPHADWSLLARTGSHGFLAPCWYPWFRAWLATHTQLFHTHTQLFHIQLVEIIDPPPSPLSFLPCPYRFNHCFLLLEEVDLCGYPVLLNLSTKSHHATSSRQFFWERSNMASCGTSIFSHLLKRRRAPLAVGRGRRMYSEERQMLSYFTLVRGCSNLGVWKGPQTFCSDRDTKKKRYPIPITCIMPTPETDFHKVAHKQRAEFA